MKKIIFYCLIAILALVLAGCGKDYKLELADATVKFNGTIQLQPITDFESPTFEWSSSNKNIATVDDNGVVTGVSAGVCNITVKIKELKNKEISIKITVLPKEYTPTEMKTLLEARLNDYKLTNNGSAKITAVHGDITLTTELSFNNTADGINTLMYKLSGTENAHVYIYDGFAYMLRDDVKTKDELSEEETELIKNDYGFTKFSEEVTKFYTETATFDALTLVSREGDVLTYSLNIASYAGEVFDTTGKDSITIKVYMNSERIAKVETIVVEGTQTSSTSIEYLVLGPVIIEFPNDLDAYPQN